MPITAEKAAVNSKSDDFKVKPPNFYAIMTWFFKLLPMARVLNK